MRTTIDLPSDLHALARQLAHDSQQTMSEVVTGLIRLGIGQSPPKIAATQRGMPQMSVGRAITAEDVRSLEDDA
jgi:predicted transcriptional regulator